MNGKVTKRPFPLSCKLLSLFLALMMVFSTLTVIAGPIVALAGTTNKAAATSGADVKLIVPETIYLYPNGASDTGATSSYWQFFVNNNSSGGAVTNNSGETTGYIYYAAPAAGTLTATYLNESFGALSGGSFPNSGSWTTSTSGTITLAQKGGKSPSLAASTNGCYIQWDLSYSENSVTKHVYAYTYVYKPYIVPVGGFVNTSNKTGGTSQTGINVWMTGMHAIGDANSGTHYIRRNGSYGFAAFISKEKTGYINDTAYTATQTTCRSGVNTYGGWWSVFNNTGSGTNAYAAFTTGDKNPSEWVTGDTAGAFGVKSGRYLDDYRSGEQNTFGYLYVPSYGTITIDTSRYTNLQYVPNLGIGMHKPRNYNATSGGMWYVADLSQGNYGSNYNTFGTRGDDYSASDFSSWMNTYGTIIAKEGNVDRTSSQSYYQEGVKYMGAWPTAIKSTGSNASNQDYYFKGLTINKQGSSDSDYCGSSATIRLYTTQYNKGTLRTAVQNAIAAMGKLGVNGVSSGYVNSAYFENDSNWKFTDFRNAYRAAVIGLTKVNQTGIDPATLAANLNNAVANLQTRVIYNANGGTFANKSTGATATTLTYYKKVGTAQSYSTCFNTDASSTYNEPTRSGYTFMGWATSASAKSGYQGSGVNFTLGYNETLYAIWKKTFTVTYAYLNSSNVRTTSTQSLELWNAETSTTATFPTAAAGGPTYSNATWTKLGWRTDDTATTAAYTAATTSVSAAATFRAVYSATYTVNYNANGGTGSVASNTGTRYMNAGSSAVAMTGVPSITLASGSALSKTGYTFNGWSASSTATSGTAAGTAVTPNAQTMTLYAAWNPNTNTKYTVYYYLQNLDNDQYTLESTSGTQKTGTTDAVVTYASLAKSITGYTYKYGNLASSVYGVTGSSETQTTILPNGSRKIYLYYDRTTTAVTASAGTGVSTASGGGTYRYGKSVSVSATPKAGYTFSGWTSSDTTVAANSTANPYTFTVSKAGAVTLTATATANTNTAYKVNYYKMDTSGNYPATPTSTSNLTGTTDSAVTIANLVNADTGFAKDKVTVSRAGAAAADYTAATVNLDGDGKLVINVYYSRNTYTLTYTAGDGINAFTATANGNAVSSGAAVYYNAVVVLSATPKNGYENIVYTGDKTTSSFNMPASNVTVTASATATDYTVSFDADGGSPVAQIGYTVASTDTLPGSSRVGYDFGGWIPTADVGVWSTSETYAEGASLNGKYGTVTLKAHWIPRTDTVYTVYYYLQDLTGATYSLESADGDGKVGTTAAEVTVANFAKDIEGFAYKYGSLTGSESGTANTATTAEIAADGSLKIYMYYDRVVTEADAQAGAGVSAVTGSGSYRYGATMSFSATVKAGYTFDKWESTDSDVVAPSTAASFSTTANSTGGNVTLTATATPNENTPYVVNYFVMDGEGAYPAAATTVSDLTGTTDTAVDISALVDPGEGFTADGVTVSRAGGDAAAYTDATVNLDGDGQLVINIYYSRNTHTLSFTAGTGVNTLTATADGAAVESGAAVYYGAAIELSATLKDGYENVAFSGDFNSATFSMPDSNVAVTASADEISYTASFNAAGGDAVADLPYTVTSEDVLPSTSYTGYTFAGWKADGDVGNWGGGTVYAAGTALAGKFGSVSLTAQWTPRNDTAYTVEHYLMDTSGAYAEEATYTDDKTGTTDATVVFADVKNTYTGFTYDADLSGVSDTIKNDGTLVIKLFYSRNQYTVTFVNGIDNSTMKEQTGVYYGTAATAPEYTEFVKIDDDTHRQFTAWSTAFDNITDDLTVTAVYADAVSHNWNEWTVTTLVNCTQDGQREHTCQDCGFTATETLTLEPLTHVDAEGNSTIETIEAVTAICTADGNNKYYHCTACDKYYTDAAGTDETTVAAQTTHDEFNHVDAEGNSTMETIEAVTAICTADGNNKYYHCTACDKYYTDAAGTDETTVAAQTTHDEFNHVDAEGTPLLQTFGSVTATCTVVGANLYYYCPGCDKYFTDAAGTDETTAEAQTFTTNPTNHVDADGNSTLVKIDAVTAICTADGNNEYWYCTACGNYYTDAAGTNLTTVEAQVTHDPHNHKDAAGNSLLTIVEGVTPTCITSGNGTYWYCSGCGKYWKNAQGTIETTEEEQFKAIDPDGHIDSDNNGYCDLCGVKMYGKGHCDYCGKIHTGAFGRLIQCIHNIFYIFLHIFGKM